MPVDRYQTQTNYKHPQDSNLLDLHKAMTYSGENKPSVRVISDHEPSSRTAFGEPIAVPLTPVIQLDALYGFDPREFEILTNGTGMVDQGASKTLFKIHTGTGPYGYGVLRSNRIIRYRPGQGVLARFTAIFENPQSGVTLRAGLFAQEQSLVLGYDGEEFGILRQNGGKAEIVKLTITSNTAGVASIVLNGISQNVTLSSTNTTTSAKEIAAASFPGWITEQLDDTVSFLSTSVGIKTPGTYSVGGTLNGTIAPIQSGVENTLNWTYQTEWNIDKLNGTGDSGIILDPGKLNIFQIQFRWLGAGEIRYSIENPINGDMIFFHHEHYSNKNTDVHLDNPSFKIGYVAANLTADSKVDAHVGGASMMAAQEGFQIDNNFPTSTSISKSGLANTTVHSLITLKNGLIYQNKINLRKIKLKRISVAFQGNDPAVLYMFLNGVKSTGHTFNRIGEFSCVYKDTSTGSFNANNELPLAEFVLPINGSGTFDLDSLELTIPSGDNINIAISSTQSISSVSASVIWVEV